MDLFVTGTDTGCGKTVVTAALAGALGPEHTAVIKPVQTGSPPDDDAAWVADSTGAATYVFERFEEALAPAVAGERSGRRIDVDDLAARTLDVHARHRLCEAAGGLLAPLAGPARDALTMRDLAVRIGWPIVIAARPGLGTLNHVALTVESAHAADLEVRGIVVSGYRGGVVEDTNLERLRATAPVLGVLPWCDPVEGCLVGEYLNALAAT